MWINKGEVREQSAFTFVSLWHEQNHFGGKKGSITERDVCVLWLCFSRNRHLLSFFTFLPLLCLYSLSLFFYLSSFCLSPFLRLPLFNAFFHSSISISHLLYFQLRIFVLFHPSSFLLALSSPLSYEPSVLE